MAAVLAFVLPFLLFIAYPSRFWNFDGVACAAALELGNPMFFFHSNHLFYGFFGFLFWKPLSFLFSRSLPALQLFTSILSAGALVFLFKSLLPVLNNKRLVLLVTVAISTTACVWMWSIEAQVYALGFLGLSAATYQLLQPHQKNKWIKVGALHALAILGHVVHVLWTVPALYWLYRESPTGQRRHLQQYLLTLISVTVIPYLFIIGFLILPHDRNNIWLMRWLMGSAALVPNSLFSWHWSGWTGPWVWALTTLRIFWGSFWPYQTTLSPWVSVLTVISMATAIGLIGMSWKQKQEKLWVFCVIWLAVYALFFWTWEPGTECYRLTDFVPLAVLFALGLKNLSRKVQYGMSLLLIGTLLPINWVSRIQPMSQAENNLVFQEIQELRAVTPEDSLYLTPGGLTWIYLLYFTGRSAWNVHSFQRNPEFFDKELDRHLKIQPIYIHAQAVDLAHASKRHKLKLVKDSLPWQQIQ